MKPSTSKFIISLTVFVLSTGLVTSQLVYQKAMINPIPPVPDLSPAPALADIDGDGDLDMFVGQYSSNEIIFFRNTGTRQIPKFERQTGTNNPLNDYSNNSGCNSPVLVDIDGDQDVDLFSGVWGYIIRHYRNEGTPASPKFVVQDGGLNPLEGVYTEGICSYPAFTDADGDQDLDAFVTDGNGNIEFFKNTGLKTAAIYQKDSANNPLRMINLSARAKMVFHDVDRDGLMDAVIGHDLPKPELLFLKNTGTPAKSVFELKTNLDNPFREITGTGTVIPVFADIDADGDSDLIIGNNYSILLYEAKAGVTTATYSPESSGISVFPNPTSGKIAVTASGLIQLQVLNIQGQSLQTLKPDLKGNQFDLASYSNGLFFLKLTTQQGMVIRKILIQH